MTEELVRTAGGLVWRRDDGVLQIAIVHRPADDDWTFPKGKLHAGESEPDAARREVEETGLRCLLGDELGTSSYRTPAAGPRPFATGR